MQRQTMKMNQSRLCDRILKSVRGRGRGAVFTAANFRSFGAAPAVRQALSRLARRGSIRRVARGVYDFPRPLALAPDALAAPNAQAVVAAIAKADNATLQPHGARAANILGLSTQVPAHDVYLSSGRSHHLKLGRRTVEIRHASPAWMVGAGTLSGVIISALKYLREVPDDALARLRARLSADERAQLRAQLPQTRGRVRQNLSALV